MPKLLSEEIFDVGIIGGGIAGCGIARDAALRGLRVVLFEKKTFGSGTSSKSSKLIHGGIRYLDLAWQAAKSGRFSEAWKNFRFVTVSLRESRILERIAPDLVKPISLTIPIYKSSGRSVWSVYFGILFYSFLAFLAGNFRLPKIFLTARSILKRIPHLNPEGLQGGVMIWDHTTADKQLVKETIESAVKTGAKAFEHAEVLNYRYQSERKIYEVDFQLNGETRMCLARRLVNASGPWVDRVRAAAGEKKEDFLVPVAGSHIILKRFLDSSVILEAEDERIFFVIHNGETSRVGTTERLHDDPDHLEPEEKEVDYLLRSLKHYFPALDFRKEDILSKEAGIRPLARPANAVSPHEISREHEIRIGPTGVIHVLGVKLTDHRRAASEVVNFITGNRKTLTHLTPL